MSATVEKLIVLTRDPSGNRRWATALEEAGFRVFSAPMIHTTPVPLTAPISVALSCLGSFDWLVLTSARAVAAIQALAAEGGISLDRVPPVATVGSHTASVAERAGWLVKFQAQPATAEALGAGLAPVNEQKILLARTDIAGSELPDHLRIRGATVTDLAVYTTQSLTRRNDRLEELVRDRQVGSVVFASTSAIAGFQRSLSPAMLERVRFMTPVVALGHPTAYAAATAGFRHVNVAAEPNAKGVIAALGGV